MAIFASRLMRIILFATNLIDSLARCAIEYCLQRYDSPKMKLVSRNLQLATILFLHVWVTKRGQKRLHLITENLVMIMIQQP